MGRTARTFLPSFLLCVAIVAVAMHAVFADTVRLIASAESSAVLRSAPEIEGAPRGKPETTGITEDAATYPQVLLSRQLTAEAGVKDGDVVTLAADAAGARARSFRVVGSYEPVPDPRKFSAKRLEARVHLPDLLSIVEDRSEPESSDQVTAVNLELVNPANATAVATAIARRIPGSASSPTRRTGGRDDPFAVLERFHWAIAVVTVTGSTAFLLALMIMRAEERRDIIGILRLIGVSSRSILGEVLLEGLLIAVAGAIFGIVVAAAAQGLVNRFFQWRYDTTLVFVRVTVPIALQAVLFAVPLGVVAGLGASWTLLRRGVVALVGR